MTSARGSAAIVIIAVIALVLGIAGTLTFQKLSKKPTPPASSPNTSTSTTIEKSPQPSSSPTDETAGWKTYNANVIKSTFKIKPGWQVKEQEGIYVEAEKNKVNTGIIINDEKGVRLMSITKNLFGGFEGNYKLIKKTDVKISGINATEEVYKVTDPEGNTSSDYQIHIEFTKDAIAYLILTSWGQNNITEKDINQILSTFRFTD